LKRLLSLLASASLLGSLLLVSTATPVFAGYNVGCIGTTLDQNNEHAFVSRDSTFAGARGEENVGYYLACTGPNDIGMSLDVLATLQGSTVTGGGNLAQCFVGNVTNEGTHFWYTPNNDGHLAIFPNEPRRQRGDHVTCTINAYIDGSNNWKWKYVITDETNGASATGYSPRVGFAKSVWWGFEVDNDGDELGGQTSSGQNQVQYPGYWLYGSSSLWYATGDGFSSFHWCCGKVGTEWYWHANVTTFGSAGYDSINGWSDWR